MVILYPNIKTIFKGGLRVTQLFGVNQEYYSQFELAGHEGLDCTPIDSDKTIYSLPFKGIVVKDIDMASKGGSYGIHNTVWYPDMKEAYMYCHLTENYLSIGQEIQPSTKIGIMGATGNTKGAHLHLNRFKVDVNGVRLNKNNGYLGGIDPLPKLQELSQSSMPETIQVPITDFERMVTEGTAYKELVKVGIKNPSDVEALRRTLTEAQNDRKTAQDEAKKAREELSRFQSQVADRLQSPQDLARILASIDELIRKAETAQEYSDSDSEQVAIYEKQIVELKSEVERLKIQLKADNPLKEATALELLQELIRRLTVILSQK